MRTLKIISIASAISLLFLAGTSHAQPAGIVPFSGVDTVSQYFLMVPANTAATYTFWKAGTTDPDPDLIVDAFGYPNEDLLQEARYVADTPTQVIFPAQAADRPIVLVVRGVPGTSGIFDGLTELHPTVGGDTSVALQSGSYSPAPSGVSSITAVATGLPTTTHISTLEEQGGTDDTILMVLGAGDVPIAYDDDNGVALMSWLHLFEDCPANNCSILVARAAVRSGKLVDGVAGPDPTNAGTTLVWDAEGGHTGPDRDGDGMGDAMEVLVGTCDPNDPGRDTDGDGKPDCDDDDVDGDGLPDLLEVVGGADDPAHETTRKNLLKFHYYGANPLQRDLFVEADWEQGYQMTPQAADAIHRVMGKGTKLHINVHIDTGNTSSTDPTVSGSWGGAELLTVPGGYCDGFSPSRANTFYHIRLFNGGAGQNTGACSGITEGGNALTFAHETGHFFGIPDSGQEESGKANCKPQYLSQMNYGYQGAMELGGYPSAVLGPYSPGTYKNLVLNPTRLDEYAGIGVANVGSQLADYLQSSSYFDREVKPNGSVDWNMDGDIAPQGTTVQAVLNYEGAKDCNLAPYNVRANKWFVRALHGAVAVMDQGLVVVGPMRDQEACVTNPPGPQNPLVPNGQMYVGVVDLSQCANPGHEKCATFNTKEAQIGMVPAPDGARSPTAAGDVVVYADGTGQLYLLKTKWTTAGGLPEIDPNAFQGLWPLFGASVSASPIAIKDDLSNRVLIFAPGLSPDGNYYLKRWEYDLTSGSVVVFGADEYWSTGDKIAVTGVDIGIGVTKGRLSTDPPGQTSIFAVIPSLLSDPTSGALPIMEIARLERTGPNPIAGQQIYTSTWSKLDPGIWADLPGFDRILATPTPPSPPPPAPPVPQVRVSVPGSVSLAFLPEGTEGRFYLAFKGNGVVGTAQFITFTRGNAPWNGTGSRPTHALAFVTPTYFGNVYNNPIGGTSLVTFDGKIRGAAEINEADGELPGEGLLCKENLPWTTFYPNADGIYNLDQTDFDDEDFIANHMAWALTQYSP